MKKPRLLQDQYPTHYLPHVGRQVMQDGGTPEGMFPRTQEEENIRANDLVNYAKQLDTREKMADVGEALGQTWPVRMAKGIMSGVTAPGDAYQGRLDPTSDEAIQRVMELTGTVMTGGFGMVPAGALGSTGAKLKSKTGSGTDALKEHMAKHIDDPDQRASNLAQFLSRSHVRDTETHEPIRLYHITPRTDIDVLRAGGSDPEISGMATWLSPYADKQPAFHNVGSWKHTFKEGTNVMPVYANIERPLVLDTPEMISWAQTVYGRDFPMLVSPQIRQSLIDDGYDGVIFAGQKNPEEYAAKNIQIGQQPNREEEVLSLFPERQLKSATGNVGTFNPDIPRLNEKRGGSVVDRALMLSFRKGLPLPKPPSRQHGGRPRT